MIHPGPIREGDSLFLGIPTGISGGSLAVTRLAALRGSPGWLVGPTGVQPWTLTGLLEREGQVLLVGPWEEGESLLQMVERKAAEALPHLARLARALEVLRGLERLPPDLQADAVFFLPGDRVLFLPPLLMRRVADSRPVEYRNRMIHALHPAGLQGEPRLSFALGVLLYRLAAGADPFPGEGEEEIHDRMRRARILPPVLAAPEVRPEVSAAILQALGREPRGRPVQPFPGELPDLRQWQDRLGAWSREGLFRTVDAAERGRLDREAEGARRRAGQAFGRKLFWRRRGRTVLLVAAAAVVVGAGLASWLAGFFAPRPTRGLTPEQVVETYYRSMGRLDIDTLQGCLVGKAGRQDVDELVRLVVVSRLAQAYEGRSSILSAEEWARQGRPPLAPPATVYGVLDLRVRPAPAGPGPAGVSRPAFIADYEKWMPVPQEGAGPMFGGWRVRDRLELRQSRGGWAIGRLERLEAVPIGG